MFLSVFQLENTNNATHIYLGLVHVTLLFNGLEKYLKTSNSKVNYLNYGVQWFPKDKGKCEDP